MTSKGTQKNSFYKEILKKAVKCLRKCFSNKSVWELNSAIKAVI